MSGEINYDALLEWRADLRKIRDATMAPLVDRSAFPSGMSEQSILLIDKVSRSATAAIASVSDDMAKIGKR